MDIFRFVFEDDFKSLHAQNLITKFIHSKSFDESFLSLIDIFEYKQTFSHLEVELQFEIAFVFLYYFKRGLDSIPVIHDSLIAHLPVDLLSHNAKIPTKSWIFNGDYVDALTSRFNTLLDHHDQESYHTFDFIYHVALITVAAVSELRSDIDEWRERVDRSKEKYVCLILCDLSDHKTIRIAINYLLALGSCHDPSEICDLQLKLPSQVADVCEEIFVTVDSIVFEPQELSSFTDNESETLQKFFFQCSDEVIYLTSLSADDDFILPNFNFHNCVHFEYVSHTFSNKFVRSLSLDSGCCETDDHIHLFLKDTDQFCFEEWQIHDEHREMDQPFDPGLVSLYKRLELDKPFDPGSLSFLNSTNWNFDETICGLLTYV